jgi:hypothetical protein
MCFATFQKPSQKKRMTVAHFGAKTCHFPCVFGLCTYAHAAFYRRFGDEASGPVDRF